ncbi:MAG: VCBS repeat-containing protein [bacterium]|nr:VCBS repeat-containing protein [bacterium]
MADLYVTGDINGDGIPETFHTMVHEGDGWHDRSVELFLQAKTPEGQFQAVSLGTVEKSAKEVFLSFIDIDQDQLPDLVLGYRERGASRPEVTVLNNHWASVLNKDLVWELEAIMPKPNTLRITARNFDVVYEGLKAFNQKNPIDKFSKEQMGQEYRLQVGKDTYVIHGASLNAMWVHMDHQKTWSPTLRWEFDYVKLRLGS